MSLRRVQRMIVALAVCPVLSQCDRRQVRSYTIEKEISASSDVLEEVSVRLPSEPPEGWQQLPAAGMRKATYRVPAGGDGSTFADVSIVSFPDSSGGLLANVNRWRLEVSLDEIGIDELKDAAPREQADDFYFYFVDLYSIDPAEEEPSSKRILGAMLPLDSETWFVKMTGPSAALALEREHFLDFVGGFGVSAGSQGRKAAEFAVGVAAVQRPGITYDLPEGWVEEAATTMRVASFSISRERLPTADFSVIPLEGTGGGLLLNIGQWRQQLGLAEISDESIATLIEEIDANGNVFRMVDLVSDDARYDGGHKARMLAAYLQTGGYGWFFKLVGAEELVGDEKAAFVGFLKSVKFPAL